MKSALSMQGLFAQCESYCSFEGPSFWLPVKPWASKRKVFSQQGSSSRSGSITFVQCFGAALNLNVHFHLLHLEGYYDTTTRAKFQKGRAPTNQNIQNLVNEISTRLVKFLRKRGYLKDPPDEKPTDPQFEQDPTHAICLSASVRYRIALGEREGKRLRFIGSGFGSPQIE